MKVLWVYFDIDTGNFIHFNHGVGDLDAQIRAHGHDSSLIYLRKEIEQDEFLSQVEAANPDLICFSTNTHQWMHVRNYARWIKSRFDIPCLAGGIHVICDPDQVIAHPAIDFICPWEGDIALPAFLQAMEKGQDWTSIKGIWSKEKNEIKKNPPQPLVEYLDTIPLSNRTIWDMQASLVDSMYEISVMAGRGCPYSCTYCANSARKQAYARQGKYVRMRSPKRLIENIETLASRYYFKTIFIEDDIFTLNKKWAFEFLSLYKERFDYPLKVYIHVEQVTRTMLEELKEAGCYMVMAGVEAGNETLRSQILARQMTNEKLKQVFAWCDEIGLSTWTFNIIGFPGETMETVGELFDLHRALAPNMAQISIFYPYPQTQLYEVCKEAGLLTKRELPTYFEHSVLDLPTISRDELEEAFWDFRKQSLEIKSHKERAGYFDFLDHLNSAEIITEKKEYVRLQLTKIWGNQRLCLYMHPPSKATWELEIKADSILKTAYALDPLCLSWGGKGVTFKIRIQETTLFERYINPKSNLHENRWHELELDLSVFSGRANIIFETILHESGDRVGAWAVWARPHLLEKENQ